MENPGYSSPLARWARALEIAIPTYMLGKSWGLANAHTAEIYRAEFPRFIADAKKRGEENIVRAFLHPPPKEWAEKRSPKPAPLSFALDADILVSHSGLVRQSLIKAGLPVVEVIHGRPRVCFLYEHRGEQTIYSHYRTLAKDPTRKAFVHFWPEYDFYWRLVFPAEKLQTLNCMPEPPAPWMHVSSALKVLAPISHPTSSCTESTCMQRQQFTSSMPCICP